MRATATDLGHQLRQCPAQWIALVLLGLVFLLGPAAAFAQDEGAPADATLQIHPEAARLQAEALIVDGQYIEAGRYLQGYLRGNPGDKEAWLLQAGVFEHIKRYDLAEKALERCGEIRGIYLARARVAFAQDKIPEAMAAVRQSLQRYPDFADAHHFLGYLYLTQKEYQPAADSLRAADRYGTSKVVPNAFYLGRAYYRLGRYDEAEERLLFAQQNGEGTGYDRGAADFLDLINLARNPAAAPVSAPKAAKPKPRQAAPSGPKKNWSAYAQLMMEYDTNVELLPDSALSTPSNDNGRTWGLRSAFAGGGDYGFDKWAGMEFHVNGDLSLLTHFAPDGAKDAQVLAIQGGGYANIRQTLGGSDAQWSPFLLGRVVSFGTFGTPRDFPGPGGTPAPDGFVDEFKFGSKVPFSIEIEPGVRFAYQRAQRVVTTAVLSYTISKFTDQAPGGGDPQSIRDAHTIRMTVGERWTLKLLNSDDLNLTGRVRFGMRSAEDPNYSFWAVEPNIRAEWRVMDPWVVEVSGRFRYENHYKSPAFTSFNTFAVARTDNTIGLTLNTRYRLLKEREWALWFVGQYLFEVNLSSSDGKKTGNALDATAVPPGSALVAGPSGDLNYDKHVISLGIRATF